MGFDVIYMCHWGVHIVICVGKCVVLIDAYRMFVLCISEEMRTVCMKWPKVGALGLVNATLFEPVLLERKPEVTQFSFPDWRSHHHCTVSFRVYGTYHFALLPILSPHRHAKAPITSVANLSLLTVFSMQIFSNSK